jgi:hypothetical protein
MEVLVEGFDCHWVDSNHLLLVEPGKEAVVGVYERGAARCRYRMAEMVKVYPLLSAVWGLSLFTEFRGLSVRAMALLVAMCVAYLLGVALLAIARNHLLVSQ